MLGMEKENGKDKGGAPAAGAVGKAAARAAAAAENPVKTETRGRKTAAEVKLEQSLDNLLKPENVKHIVSVPFDLSQAFTGSDLFELSEGERDTLAITGAAAMKEFGITDTKWLAIGIFGVALLNIYGSKMAAFRREQKEKAAKRDKSSTEKA